MFFFQKMELLQTTTMLIFFINGIMPSYTPKQDQTGVIFTELAETHLSYTKWHICYYFDLINYYEEIRKLEICIDQMKKICSQLQDNSTCSIIINQFNNHLETIQIESEAIESFSSIKIRSKRAPFEFIGKIFNMAFGIMGAESARQYDVKSNELQKESVNTEDLMKSQTLLVQRDIKLNNKTFEELKLNIRKLYREIENLANKIGITINDLTYQSKFKDIAQIATLVIMDHNSLAKDLMDTLQNSLDGKISNLVPVKTIREDLKKISLLLTKRQKLPIDINQENTYHLYKVMTVRSTLINKKMLIEIGIPIVEDEKFKLFKAIPIPTSIFNNLVILQPNSKYFLANIENLEYIPLDEEELSNCKHTFDNSLICTPYSPVFRNKDICELGILTTANLDKICETCSFKIIPRANYMIQINHQDQYYCFVDTLFKIVTNCENNALKIDILNSSGILKIEPNCIITTDELKIRSHNVKYFNDTNVIIPRHNLSALTNQKLYNLTKNITHSITSNDNIILIQDHAIEFEKLIQESEDIIDKENNRIAFEEIHYDSLKHKIMLSTISITLIIMVILATYMMIV